MEQHTELRPKYWGASHKEIFTEHLKFCQQQSHGSMTETCLACWRNRQGHVAERESSKTCDWRERLQSLYTEPHALWSEVWNVSKVVGVFGGLWSGDVACPWKVALAAVRRVICSKAWVEAERPVSRPLQLSKMNTIVTKWWREDRFWAYFIEAIGLANR